jgi:hypothetical protein
VRRLSLFALLTLVACGGRTPNRDDDCRHVKGRPNAYTLAFWEESGQRYRADCSRSCDHPLCDVVYCCPTDFGK